ncbi:DUF1461 domain-containing protein [Gilvimarinus sp. SDUM040013]|uniref:DUF1461 domain-containing protein n=1 Tax=Gilvimarinus gilvus TaxID=3058038 RepID=A0ABU4RW32_9GAMM|nr:DUF1461 domain-containing protein [Gilvimarinus sp. SDUM040013]MDO3386489.1 DUF1461 domain-containing protein [Gilvimarinus sp. SDUM040013]MDX6849065.1 DUF1461 domain-containing protein [Gilvimarinus sp. SDUM040013]
MRFTSPLWIVFLLGHWLASGFASWNLLASADFGYASAYQVLDIDEHIATYGPQNRYRDNFALTDKDQHLELFHQINIAVHQRPETLGNIKYYPSQGASQTLLTEPEALHLTDVALLIDKVYWLGWLAIIAFAISATVLWQLNAPLPRPRRVIGSVLGAIFATLALVLVVGPKKVFYYLHTWVFPPEHPWFFYYQDSLMTTLMKAPDLFGFIATLLLGLWLIIWASSLYLIIRLWPSTR